MVECDVILFAAPGCRAVELPVPPMPRSTALSLVFQSKLIVTVAADVSRGTHRLRFYDRKKPQTLLAAQRTVNGRAGDARRFRLLHHKPIGVEPPGRVGADIPRSGFTYGWAGSRSTPQSYAAAMSSFCPTRMGPAAAWPPTWRPVCSAARPAWSSWIHPVTAVPTCRTGWITVAARKGLQGRVEEAREAER